MSTALGSRSQPIIIQSSPSHGEVFQEVEEDFPDDVSSMDCPIGASSDILDNEDIAQITGETSINADLESEAPPDQGAHETSASTTDADLEHSDSEDSYSEDSDSEDFELEENAREVMSKCRELVQKSRQSKRKYEEIHQADAETYRQYVTAAEKQSSELLNDRNAIFAQLVLAEAEIKKLRSWKSRHITKKKCLESQLKQLQEKFEIEKCPICGDRVAEAETKCGHFFCWGCLWNWHVQQRNLTAGIHTCAMCRRYLGDIDCGLEELATPRKRSRRNGNSISVL